MIIQALKKVYRKPVYLIITLVISVAMFALAMWLPNIALITSVTTAEDVSLGSKIELLFNLLGSIGTNFTLLSASYTIVIVILLGIYVAMLTYFLKKRIKEVGRGGVATGFLGVMSSVLGVGCAACGSFLLISVLSFFGASSALAFLPLGGSEFGILGVLLLILAIYMTAKKIQDPVVCQTEN